MKRLKPILKRIAKTENLNIVSAEQSYKAVENAMKINGTNIDNYHCARHENEPIGIWGCFARQEVDDVIQQPLIYFLEMYQLNKNDSVHEPLDSPITVVIIWHYDTEGKMNNTPQFLIYKNQNVKQTRGNYLNALITIPSGKNIRLLPEAKEWSDAHRMTMEYWHSKKG